MLPLSPDHGLSLEEKEKHYYGKHDSALFYVTPGSTRDGKHYPSASVADEMGMARVKYAKERIFYLVEEGCNIQPVDQKCYVKFVKTDFRSIILSAALPNSPVYCNEEFPALPLGQKPPTL